MARCLLFWSVALFRLVEGFRSVALFRSVEGFRSPGYVHLCGFSDGERVRGARRRAPDTPVSRPAKSPLRGSLGSISSLQVGRDTASCLSRPQPRIPAGLTWLVNCASAILMPDSTPPTLRFLFFTEMFLSL